MQETASRSYDHTPGQAPREAGIRDEEGPLA
jgi:hypothetical protein